MAQPADIVDIPVLSVETEDQQAHHVRVLHPASASSSSVNYGEKVTTSNERCQHESDVTSSISHGTCLACKKAEIEYETASCHHKVFCKRCAMKCATGGKCKVCGELFPSLKRVF